MKILVCSDSHGNTEHLLRVLELEQPEMVIHLGDGERDVAVVRRRYPELDIRQVQGNCDVHSAAPLHLTLTVEGVKIFAVHGHEYGVKYDRHLTRLRYGAMEAGAQVALFGHTHRPYQDHSLGMELLNPGSIGLGYPPGYGILTIENGAARTELRSL